MGNINEEIVWYLEDRMTHGEETEAEMNLYIDYQTYGSFNVRSNTYKRLKINIKTIINEGY